MQKRTTILLATAIVGTIGFTSFAPAFAQDVANNDRGGNDRRGERMAPRGGEGGPGGFVRLMCSDDGATRLETALGNISKKLELTAEQQTAFDALQTAALAAQTDYADNCTAPDPAADAAKPDMIDHIKTRQANMQAYVTAMDSVVPALETFYDSLTDTQKADLMKGGQRMHNHRRGDRHGQHGDHRGGDHRGGPNGPRGEAPIAG